MTQTNINISMDEDLKKPLDNFCSIAPDINGFTPAEAAELEYRIADMAAGNGKEHDLIDV